MFFSKMMEGMDEALQIVSAHVSRGVAIARQRVALIAGAPRIANMTSGFSGRFCREGERGL